MSGRSRAASPDIGTDAQREAGKQLYLKNCSQCHAGPDGNAGLDLMSWVPAPDGKSRTFPHLDLDRKQIVPHDTLTRMAERLSATDPAIRMPKQMVMAAQERQELFRWVQEELARIAKEAAR